MYEIILSKTALQDIETLVKSVNRPVIRKVYRLLEELKINPFYGTGKIEQLKYRPGCWARRISGEHWLVYTVEHSTVTVNVLDILTHYEDK